MVRRVARTLMLSVVAVGAAAPAAAPATAAVAEPLRVRASTALIDEVVAGLLPLDVVLPAQSGTAPDAGSDGTPQAALITELRYCGATDRGTGRFRAVMRWGALGAGQQLLSGSDGCRQTLGDLAKQAVADSGVAVADLEATWRPWELRLSMARVLMPPAPTPPRPGPPRPLGGLEIHRDLLLLPTAGLRIPTDAGETITVHAAPVFATDGIDAVVIVAEAGSGPPAGRPATNGGALSLSGEANLIVDLPHAASNQILRQLTGNQPLAVPVERDVLDLQNLALSSMSTSLSPWGASGSPAGSGAAVVLAGTATPRSLRETVRITVGMAGGDLKVVGLRADAQLENCAALGGVSAIACSARNAARNAAAAALSAALGQRYQGRMVRELAGRQTLAIDVLGRRLELRGELTRTALGPRGLIVWGRLSPGAGH